MWTDALFNVWFWVSVVGVLVGLLLMLIAFILIRDRRAAREFADQYNKDMDITHMVAMSGHGLEETTLISVPQIQWRQDMEIGEDYARHLRERVENGTASETRTRRKPRRAQEGRHRANQARRPSGAGRTVEAGSADEHQAAQQDERALMPAKKDGQDDPHKNKGSQSKDKDSNVGRGNAGNKGRKNDRPEDER